jgi:nitrile hydratase accessory protein
VIKVGPVFAAPWQAQALALAVELSAQGHFTWKEWSSTLAEELKSAADGGDPDDGTRYYEHWLAALERLVTQKLFRVERNYLPAKKRGPMPTATRRMENPSNCQRLPSNQRTLETVLGDLGQTRNPKHAAGGKSQTYPARLNVV